MNYVLLTEGWDRIVWDENLFLSHLFINIPGSIIIYTFTYAYMDHLHIAAPLGQLEAESLTQGHFSGIGPDSYYH